LSAATAYVLTGTDRRRRAGRVGRKIAIAEPTALEKGGKDPPPTTVRPVHTLVCPPPPQQGPTGTLLLHYRELDVALLSSVSHQPQLLTTRSGSYRPIQRRRLRRRWGGPERGVPDPSY
jgi:hypothetical protein